MPTMLAPANVRAALVAATDSKGLRDAAEHAYFAMMKDGSKQNDALKCALNVAASGNKERWIAGLEVYNGIKKTVVKKKPGPVTTKKKLKTTRTHDSIHSLFTKRKREVVEPHNQEGSSS